MGAYMRIKVNYKRGDKPTSAVVSSEVAKFFGAVHGLPIQPTNEDCQYQNKLQTVVQKFVYKQTDLQDRNDIENRMLKAIVQNQSKLGLLA